MKGLRTAVVAATIVVSLGSCGGEGDAPNETAGPGNQRTHRWTVEEAGRRYEKAVVAVNENEEIRLRLVNVKGSPQDIASIARVCMDRIGLELEFLRFLRNGKWPRRAIQPARDLAKADLAELRGYRECADSTTEADLASSIQTLNEVYNSQNAAQAIRESLGLSDVRTE